ncbi:MAG: hypothetical protein EP343_15790 [Deltaproteobacteria bacterium]|nr:MAG: hypothetical protein EP343_15790 [Deltaproteobacteria bacterium]
MPPPIEDSHNPLRSDVHEGEPRTPFDGLLKHLTDQFAPELLTYLGDLDGLLTCEPVGGEVEIMHRLTDRVWRVTQHLDGEPLEYLFHLEFESGTVASIERRLGMYSWALYEKEGLPVRNLVWYVGDQKPTGWPKDTWRVECEAEMTIGNDIVSTLRWWEVWLPGGFQAPRFVKEAPAYLLPFAVLMKGMKKPLLAQLKRMIQGSGLAVSNQHDLLAMVVFFACRRYSLDEVIKEINMDIFEDNPLTEYLFNKGVEKGREEGREEGRHSLIELLQGQAKKRFPHIGDGTLQLLEELSLSALRQLGDELLELPNGRTFRQTVLSLRKNQ